MDLTLSNQISQFLAPIDGIARSHFNVMINTPRTAILCLLVLVTTALKAQNTIGGLQKEVPESEIEQQNKFLEAESMRMLGKYEEAIGLYKKLLYKNEKIGAAWYGLSRSHTSLRQYPEALDAVTKAIDAEKDNEWYYIHQADLLEQQGRIKEAAKVYENLTKKVPNNAAHLERWAYLAVLAGDPQTGIKALDRLEKIRGINEATSIKKHLIYVGLKDNRKAAQELQRLADAYPSDLEYRHRVAKFYVEIGDQAAARIAYQEILKRRPDDSAARFALLDQQKASSDAAFAQSLLPLFQDPAVPMDAKVKQIAPLLGKLEKGDDPLLTASMLALGTAVEKAHSADAKAWSLSGDLYYLANQNDAALERYKKCIALRPKVFSVWDNALQILDDKNKPAEQLPLAEQALDAFPNQPKAYYWYGKAANALNKPDDALAQLDQALLMTANNPSLRAKIVDQMGIAHIAKRDYPAAIAKYEANLAKGGDTDASYLEHYGDALAAASQPDKAREIWKKALAIQKTPALEQKIRN
jgi:tetratricopeptide (TPR) repeat protein